MKITCETKDTLPLSTLTEFQGGLKIRTNTDVDKIITSIKKYGFFAPFFVWKHDGINHVLDGHGRLTALKKIAKTENIPPLPVVYVDCTDEEDARNKLLRICSQYGKMTEESVLDFMGDFNFEFDELQLPDGILELDRVMLSDDFSDDFTLPDGEKGEIVSVTFTLHEEQKQLIEYATALCKDKVKETFGNSNSNGNALYEVVRQWAELKK